jgi:WbqC-like protein family
MGESRGNPAALAAASARGARVAIVQSSYIPWKGYFDLINMSDTFVLLDEVQYTKRDWRSRNRIKSPNGEQWLTVPVQVKGRYHQRIDETLIADTNWAEKHWKTLAQSYARAGHFGEHADRIEALYRDAAKVERLSDVNRLFIESICELLGISTKLSWSTDYQASEGKSERLLDICVQAGAEEYLSGPAAQAYLDEEMFAGAGVAVSYIDYSGYPEYQQVHPPFSHQVTVLDLLFCTGSEAPRYMKSFA